MNIWKILNINKTKDKNEIKAAYRKLLVTCNPEENEKGFIELRQAYDEAMRLTDEQEEAEDLPSSSDGGELQWDDTPVGVWMSKVEKIYHDIRHRADIAKWEELLREDVCFSLDTKTQARDALLRYLMDHNYLPQKVWQLLDDQFMLMEYKNELYEIFPVDYIDRGVIENIKYKEFIDFDRLESRGGTDYDEYMRACNATYYYVTRGELDKAQEALDKMESLKIYHPYGEVWRVKYLLAKEEYELAEKKSQPMNAEESELKSSAVNGDPDSSAVNDESGNSAPDSVQAQEYDSELYNSALQLFDELIEKYPEDIHILRSRAVFFAKRDRLKQARLDYERILKLSPDYYDVLIELGNVYFASEDYQNAKEKYDQAYDIHKNNYLRDKIDNCVEKLEEIYQSRYDENPKDIKNCIELARIKYQSLKSDEAIQILGKIIPDDVNRIEYAHILGCCYMYEEKYGKALPYIEEWTHKTEQLIGAELSEVKRSAHEMGQADGETTEKLFIKLSENESFEMERADYDKAVKRLVYAYLYMAYTLDALGEELSVADEYIEKAIATKENTIDAYEYKARIYFRRKKYNEIIKICDHILEYDVNSITAYAFRAQAFYELGYIRDAAGEWEKCIRLEPYDLVLYFKKIKCLLVLDEYEQIDEIVKYLDDKGVQTEGFDMIKASIEGSRSDGDYREALVKLYRLIDKEEQKCEPDSKADKSFLAELYYEVAQISFNKEKDNDKAILYLDKALDLDDEFADALDLKAFILWKKQDLDKALECYKKLIEEKPYHLNAYGYMGEVYETMRNYAQAVECYTKQLRIVPNAYIYLSRAWCLASMFQFEAAREDYGKCIELDPEGDNGISAYRNMANTYVYDEREERSIELYQKALALDTEGNQPYIYTNLANAYRRMGKYHEAIELMQECIDRYHNPQYRLELADIFREYGLYDAAIQEYHRYAADGKEARYRIIHELADSVFLSGRMDEAESLIYEAITSGVEFDPEGKYLDRWGIDVCNAFVRMDKGKYLGLKFELGSLIKSYLKKDVGSGEIIILMRFLMELRHNSCKKIKYNLPLLSEVTDKFANHLKHQPCNVANEARILCEKAVLCMEYGDLEQALSYVNQIFRVKRCHNCNYGKCSEGIFVKALILELMGNENEAYELYKEAATIDKSEIMYQSEYDRLRKKHQSEYDKVRKQLEQKK